MSTETCAVCGCDIALLPKKGAKPVRHQAKTYCGACAKLILDPATSQAAEDIEVPEPIDDEVASGKTPFSVSAIRRATGVEVVEEFNIKAVGKPQKERNLDEDEWFKPGAPKAGGSNASVAVKDKKGAASISKRSDEKRPSNRMNAAKPSDRLQKSGSKPSGRLAAAEPAPEDRKGSRRTARPSGRLGKASPSRARMAPAAPAAAPADVPAQDSALIDEENLAAPVAPAAAAEAPDALEPEAPKKSESARMKVGAGSRKSSRTMKAAKRGSSSSAKSGRNEREDRNERGRGAKGRGSAGNNNTMMIGLGIAGVVLLVICVACLSGKSTAPEKKAPTASAPLTSAAEYAERGKQLLAKGDRIGAADMYSKAADAAGSDEAAQKYNMQAYEIRKFTTLNMSGGR